MERVLIVDDNVQNLILLETHLSNQGYEVVTARNGMEALEKIRKDSIDLVLLDVMMPGMDGYEVCRRIKENEETRIIPVVMVTALKEMEDKIRGIEAGADDFLSKPYNKLELLTRVKSLLRVKKLNEELERAQNVLYSLATAIEVNDPYTHGHSERVSELSGKVAERMGLPPKEQELIRRASLLHDIGKIGINVSVIHKPGPLTEDEFAIVKTHPIIGEKICSPLRFARPMIPIIKYHHERLDGKGYPEGLKGDKIPIGARIVAVVDAYDAFTSRRPYRSAISSEDALAILRAESREGRWDRDVVDVLCEIVEEGKRDR